MFRHSIDGCEQGVRAEAAPANGCLLSYVEAALTAMLEFEQMRSTTPASRYLVMSDPIGLRGGVSADVYVSSRPIRESDKWGLQGARAFFGCMSSPPPDLIAFAQAQSAIASRTPYREPPKPDQCLPNGNMQPDYRDQDMKCSEPAGAQNGTAAELCCITHDS
jgi:hypothetical protein